MPQLDRPIVILGAARSGTTLIAEILERHTDVAYWIEPKYVWRYGRPLATDDIRVGSEATPRVANYIRRAFSKYAKRHGTPRFMEKTPSNCFRVPFVHAVLPDARFLHIIRDGRDVASSALKRWTLTPIDPSAILRRFTSLEIPLRDFPFYAVDAFRGVAGRQLVPAKGSMWGPQFPGIREIVTEEGVEAACAVQWRESVRAAQAGLASVPPDQQLTVRFEDLVHDPAGYLSRILDFLSLSSCDAVFDYASETIEDAAASRWKSDGENTSFDSYLQPLLSELGYSN